METTYHSNGRANLYQDVTNRILELLESQKLTWNKPWVSVIGKPAHNAISQRTYSGLNQILLSIRQEHLGLLYNGWLTFSQIQELGGRVIAGETSSAICYYKIHYFDHDDKKVSQEEFQRLTKIERERRGLRKHFLLRYYNVFNIGQTKGLPSALYKVDIPATLTWKQKDDRSSPNLS